MNFILSSTTLLRHLQSISGVLSTSNSMPILDNFLFEINESNLIISASDLETTMRTSLDVEAKESGKIAANIPHPELYKSLRQWRDSLAEEWGVPVYLVLAQKSILELIQSLP